MTTPAPGAPRASPGWAPPVDDEADADAEASRIIRLFARETNLLVAGRPVRVIGADAVAKSARALARALGAQMVPAQPSVLPGVEATTEPAAWQESLLEIDVTSLPGRMSLGGSPLPSRSTAASRIDFAGVHMPITRALATELATDKTVAGLRIGVCLTLEPKTAQLALHLTGAGADVCVYAHPDETDSEVATELRARGIHVVADAAASGDGERAAAIGFIRRGLDVLVDDGSHLVRLAHQEAPQEVRRWIGVSEETTSGLTLLRAMSAQGVLGTAVIAVNDAATKTGFDNRYGTGQSCVFAIVDLLEESGVDVRDQPALVIGYGPVGQGVAAHFAALGAEVRVSETNPVRALLAQHDGYRVGRAADLGAGALVVSATGVAGTVDVDLMRSALAVAVAGGVPGEIDLDEALEGDSLEPVSRAVERLAGAGTLVLDRGGCINITAAEGNPIEIMDLSFATQLAAIRELVTTRPGVGVHAMTDAAVAHVGAVAARERGVELDRGVQTDPEAQTGAVELDSPSPKAADAAAAFPAADGWHSPRFKDAGPNIGRSSSPTQETS